MRRFLRKPLPWMVLAESAIVAALVIVAWHLVTNAPSPMVQVLPAASPAAGAGNPAGPIPAGVNAARKHSPSPAPPGLNVTAGFWRLRLAELNRGQAAFEALEWRLVRSAIDAARRYVDSVVIPSVTRAEGAAAPPPAITRS